jgi:hypothetical protein
MTGSWLRAWIRSGAGVYRRLLDVPLRCPFHVPLLIANCSFDQRRAAPDTRRQTFRWSIIAKAPKSQTRQNSCLRGLQRARREEHAKIREQLRKSRVTALTPRARGAPSTSSWSIRQCDRADWRYRSHPAHAQLSRDLGAETQRSFNKIDHMCRCVDCEWVLRKALPRRYIPRHLAGHFELMIGRRGEQ